MACCRAATSATTLRRGATGRGTAVTERTKKYDYYGFIREINKVLKFDQDCGRCSSGSRRCGERIICAEDFCALVDNLLKFPPFLKREKI